MYFREDKTDQVFEESDYRQMNPATPSPLTCEAMLNLGLTPILLTPKPDSVDPLKKYTVVGYSESKGKLFSIWGQEDRYSGDELKQKELQIAVEDALQKIDEHHDARKKRAVVFDLNGTDVDLVGGKDSMLLYMARSTEMEKRALTEAIMTDVYKMPHTFTKLQIDQAGLAIGARYDSDKREESAAIVAVRQAETKAEVEQALSEYLAL